MKNKSPWLESLNRTRPISKLKSEKADIVIIGGGIAGISTAYYILTRTKSSVILLEADKIAHGATGHNAGQIASYFERPFYDIVNEFGLEKAARAQQDVLSAWSMLKDIHFRASLKTPFSQFIGYAGCSTKEQVLDRFKNKLLRHKAGIRIEMVYISDQAPYLKDLEEYKHLYEIIPKKHILSILQTKDENYTAAFAARKGYLNTAAFCEELVSYLLFNYPKRFQVAEKTPAKKIILGKNQVTIMLDKNNISSNKVVLCTNGFEGLKIKNIYGYNIDTKFHEHVYGIVGYMTGYLENPDRSPAAISYFSSKISKHTEPYFYLTRRYYNYKNSNKNLVCIGGPETKLSDATYNKNKTYLNAQKDIEEFVEKTYSQAPRKPNYAFKWQGLMGYTKNGLRLVGAEPCNPLLLYNLGCNGVGILPSIYGGHRISKLINNEKVEESIFDPQDQSCFVKNTPTKAIIPVPVQ